MEDDASILHVNELSYTMVKLKGYLHDFDENISYIILKTLNTITLICIKYVHILYQV